MTSTPDSVSMSDLMSLHEQASERAADELEKLRNEGPFPNGMSEDQYHDAVLEGLKEVHDSLCHPMFAKIVSLELLNKLVEWHSDRATEEFADGDPDCGICWARDAGKLQAAMENIIQVMLPDDYIFRASGRK